MKSADDIRQLFKNAELRIHPDADERMFEDVLQARRHPLKDQPATPDSTWRKIMRSPLTKLAAAAVVVIACLIGLSFWRTTGSGIALADVLARIEQVKAFRFQWSDKIAGDKPYSSEVRGTMLISQEYGSKQTWEDTDPNGGWSTSQEVYRSPDMKTWTIIHPKQKKYLRLEYDDSQAEQFAEQIQERDPRTLTKRILKYKYESMGRATIDGIEVEGFRTTDPNWTLANQYMENIRRMDVKMWADVKTRLPVRYEEAYVHPDKFTGQFVIYDFQWDVPVAAAEFKPIIPDDYTGRVVKYPAHITEETAIQGLKVWVELLGKYPDPEIITNIGDVAPTVLRLAEKSETPAAMRLREETKGLTDDEISNKLVDFLVPIRGLAIFYPQSDRKDRAYYGKTVTPKDADKVLMRWKVSDKEYRVIFGDLHAETVTPARLAELEAALPK